MVSIFEQLYRDFFHFALFAFPWKHHRGLSAYELFISLHEGECLVKDFIWSGGQAKVFEQIFKLGQDIPLAGSKHDCEVSRHDQSDGNGVSVFYLAVIRAGFQAVSYGVSQV